MDNLPEVKPAGAETTSAFPRVRAAYRRLDRAWDNYDADVAIAERENENLNFGDRPRYVQYPNMFLFGGATSLADALQQYACELGRKLGIERDPNSLTSLMVERQAEWEAERREKADVTVT